MKNIDFYVRKCDKPWVEKEGALSYQCTEHWLGLGMGGALKYLGRGHTPCFRRRQHDINAAPRRIGCPQSPRRINGTPLLDAIIHSF